ncbi:hypothetical protein C815_00855 [Firmicutes bacterium M10-2]|nr:hypothetical protein C815_00855 [Firmicutes bacterium M10-2]
MKKKKQKIPKVLISFFAISVMMLSAIEYIENTTARQSGETIANTLEQIVTNTYADTGKYPQSLQAIEEEHTFTYDKDQFLIVYEVFADNIRPRIKIIERKSS